MKKTMQPLFLAATIFFLCASCSKKTELTTPAPITDSTINNSDTGLSFLALGDSYTIGQSVPASDRFPVQAAAMLNDSGIAVKKPAIIAVTGWSTADLLEGIAYNDPKPGYDIITLLIGVNDQFRLHDTTGYRARFTACLNEAGRLRSPTGHIFILSIPDYSYTPFGRANDPGLISDELADFNLVNRSVAEKAHIPYTDVTTISTLGRNDASMIAPDGLHPSGKQYKLWAEALVKNIRSALQ